MIKRILAVSLALLLCVPLLAATVSAETQYTFVTSPVEDFILYSGPLSDAPSPGLYSLDCNIYLGEWVSFSFSDILISYIAVEPYIFVSSFSAPVEYFGQSFIVEFTFSIDLTEDLFYFYSQLGTGMFFEGTFVLSSVDSASGGPLYSWSSFVAVPGGEFPPDGVYTIRVTAGDQVVERVVNLVKNPSGDTIIEMPALPEMPAGSVPGEFTALILRFVDGISIVRFSTWTDDIPIDATIEFLTPKSSLDVLLDSIGLFLRSAVSMTGFVVNALLAPDGGFSPLWPLIGLAVGFALVPAGIALVERFRL